MEERKLPEVEALCRFIYSATMPVIIEFRPYPWGSYRLLERSIEACDAFVAVPTSSMGSGALQLMWYAHRLRSSRMTAAPRVFALQVEGGEMPPAYQSFSVEWLGENNYHLVLEDLPLENNTLIEQKEDRRRLLEYLKQEFD